MTPAEQKLVEIPQSSKSVHCSGCGREMTVSSRTVMAFCKECSAKMGEKK